MRPKIRTTIAFLSDQPLLETADIDRLADAFSNLCPRSALVPTWRGRRGNPIVLAWSHRAEILAGGRNLGCKRLIQTNRELVWPFEMQNDHCVFDVDSTQDDQRLRFRRVAKGAGQAALPIHEQV
ncbi:MAG: hypothetical protein WBG92_17535 [Thiohalocapsa sp.]